MALPILFVALLPAVVLWGMDPEESNLEGIDGTAFRHSNASGFKPVSVRAISVRVSPGISGQESGQPNLGLIDHSDAAGRQTEIFPKEQNLHHGRSDIENGSRREAERGERAEEESPNTKRRRLVR